MTFRMLAFAALAGSAVALSACVTEEGYRQHMTQEIGRSTDDILVRWGPPQNRTGMSEGRELWSYSKVTFDDRPAYYEDATRQVTRKYRDKDGKEKSETITETYPVLHPATSYRSVCNTRFVMSGGRVMDVTFEGEGCVAEEIK